MNDELASLRELDRDALLERYRTEVGREPRRKNRQWLLRRLMWKEQERRLGGLSATARAKLEALIAEIEHPPDRPDRVVVDRVERPRKLGELSVGTSVQRDYKGQRAVLRVLDDGFAVNFGGVELGTFKSISAAAGAVCLQHVSGRLWWRCVSRRKAS